MTVYDLKTMQICKVQEKTIVALGIFDGCHLGHASVLRSAFYMAKAQKIKSLAYTFDTVGLKGQESIMTLEERVKAIRAFGIDYLAIESLENVRAITGEEFVKDTLMGELNAVGASCGYNFRFGKNASSSAEDLKAFFKNCGGSVQISEEISYKSTPVSSTVIRGKIKNGQVEEILEYMRPYSIYSVVEKGKGMGKGMGFATINQKMPQGKVVPKTGVYITECEIGEDVYPSVTNIGYRPTTDGENDRLNVETHIIGYSGSLYFSCVRVNFYKYIREEKRFDRVDELVLQIEKDKNDALDYFGTHIN